MESFNPFSLEGRTIIITGASSGIGKQCAIDCSKMGAKIILIARNEERLKETLSLMNNRDNHAYYLADFTQLTNIADLIKEIVSANGKISGFIHAAGIELTKPLKLISIEDYEKIFRINTLSGFEFIHQFSNKKNFEDGGHIVLISSITSIIGRGGVAAYSASKGAMISAIRSMAIELSKKKICINCISPGTILTPLMANFLSTLSEEQYLKRVSGFPLGFGKCTDISNACIYLLSDASQWITGQNFIIDGGYTIL